MSVAADDVNAKVLGERLSAAIERAVGSRGVPVTDAEVSAVVDDVLPLIEASRREFYASQVRIIGQDMAELGLEVSPAPLRPYDRSAVDKAVRRAAGLVEPSSSGEVVYLDRATRAAVAARQVPASDPKGVAMMEMFRRKLAVSAVRHARQAGRNAVADTAKKGRVREIGSKRPVRGARWARVLTGAENCAFCAMLASRGPAYASEDTASGQWHDHCDCVAVMVIPGRRGRGRRTMSGWSGCGMRRLVRGGRR